MYIYIYTQYSPQIILLKSSASVAYMSFFSGVTLVSCDGTPDATQNMTEKNCKIVLTDFGTVATLVERRIGPTDTGSGFGRKPCVESWSRANATYWFGI